MREDVNFFPLAFIIIRRIGENIFIDLKKILSLMTPFWRIILHLINRIKLIFFFCQNKNWKKIQTSEKNIRWSYLKKPYFFSLHKGRPAFVVCKALMSVVLSAVLLAFYRSKSDDKKNSRVKYLPYNRVNTTNSNTTQTCV